MIERRDDFNRQVRDFLLRGGSPGSRVRTVRGREGGCRAQAPTAPVGYDDGMRFGIATFITDEGIRPDALGRALEERGFSSLFVAEHSHIPVNRESPYPAGGELPRSTTARWTRSSR